MFKINKKFKLFNHHSIISFTIRHFFIIFCLFISSIIIFGLLNIKVEYEYHPPYEQPLLNVAVHPIFGQIIENEFRIVFTPTSTLAQRDSLLKSVSVGVVRNDYGEDQLGVIHNATLEEYEEIIQILHASNLVDIAMPNYPISGVFDSELIVVTHPQFGKIVGNEILIVFEPDTTLEQIQKVIDNLSAYIRGYLPLTNRYQIRFKKMPTFEEYTDIIEQLRKKDFILFAMPNSILESL